MRNTPSTMERDTRNIAIFIIILLIAQGIPVAATINVFSDGKHDAIAWLQTPTFTDQINISIQADAIINKATMEVSSVLPDANGTTCPRGVQIFLNDSLLWEFNGLDYGALGRQDTFLYGGSEVKMKIGPGGGTNGTRVRLMKNAKILNATTEVDCGGSAGGLGLALKAVGPSADYNLGGSARGAGDVNGDGYDDVIIGSAAGHSYLVFGGPNMKNLTILDFKPAVAGNSTGFMPVA